MLSTVATTILAQNIFKLQPAIADVEYTTLYGLASPPTSYGGYGGNNKNEAPKYKFEYPINWRKDSIGKNDKGTKGIDSRVVNKENPKGQRAFVIVFGRAGEDDAAYEVKDPEKALTGFSLADQDLSQAIESAINIDTSQRDVQGRTFYDYNIQSPDVRYLVSITINEGKIYAIFVKCPVKLYKRDLPILDHIKETFAII